MVGLILASIGSAVAAAASSLGGRKRPQGQVDPYPFRIEGNILHNVKPGGVWVTQRSGVDNVAPRYREERAAKDSTLLRHIEDNHNRRQRLGFSERDQLEALAYDLAVHGISVSIPEERSPVIHSRGLKLKVWLYSVLTGRTPFQVYWEMRHEQEDA